METMELRWAVLESWGEGRGVEGSWLETFDIRDFAERHAQKLAEEQPGAKFLVAPLMYGVRVPTPVAVQSRAREVILAPGLGGAGRQVEGNAHAYAQHGGGLPS